jgi:nitrate reductase NapE component
VTTPPAMSGPSARDSSVVNRLQPSEPAKERHVGLIVVMIIFALLLISLVGWLGLVNGEYLCLDRRPWWGPPENPEIYTSCSGHIDELLRKWGRRS